MNCTCRRIALTGARLALASALALAAISAGAEPVTLIDQRTAFQHLSVVEDAARHERYLYSDDRRYMQGMISLRRPDHLDPAYLRSALLGLVFAPAEPKAMLFVGLGAGSLPRYLCGRYPRTRLDAVEIDPAVPPIARRYFALPRAPNLNVIVREGRDFIRGHAGQYDLILMDAYFGSEIPPQLATREFMGELRGVLKPGGVVIANLPAPEIAVNFWSVVVTYRASFPHVRVFATESPVNFILLASGAELSPDEAIMRQRILQLQRRHRIDVDLGALAALSPAWGEGPKDAPELHDSPQR